MDKLILFHAKLKTLPSEIPRLLAEVFEEIASVVEDANILQLQAGQRGDGTFLPDYSPISVEVFGKPEGPIRLFETGAFYRGITMRVIKELGIELTGLDIKTEMLLLRYGEEVLSLTEESLERLKQDYVLDLLSEKVKAYLLEQ